VSSDWDIVGSDKEVHVVSEQLATGQHPVSESKEQNWSVGHNAEHAVIQFVVVHGWLSIAVVDHEFFDDIEDKDFENGNWEEEWDTESIEESYENNIEDSRVLVMDEVHGTTVQFNVLLKSRPLGLQVRARA